MGNLNRSLLEMHFKAQISNIITLKGKSRKLGTFRPKLAKFVTLNKKSKEIISSNQLISQN